jgi:hypothetical protein
MAASRETHVSSSAVVTGTIVDSNMCTTLDQAADNDLSPSTAEGMVGAKAGPAAYPLARSAENVRQKYQGNGDQSGSRFSRNWSRPSTASSVM